MKITQIIYSLLLQEALCLGGGNEGLIPANAPCRHVSRKEANQILKKQRFKRHNIQDGIEETLPPNFERECIEDMDCSQQEVKEASPDDYQFNRKWNYLMNQCKLLNNPCNPLNTRECLNIWAGYTCICKDGWGGKHCTEKEGIETWHDLFTTLPPKTTTDDGFWGDLEEPESVVEATTSKIAAKAADLITTFSNLSEFRLVIFVFLANHVLLAFFIAFRAGQKSVKNWLSFSR